MMKLVNKIDSGLCSKQELITLCTHPNALVRIRAKETLEFLADMENELIKQNDIQFNERSN